MVTSCLTKPLIVVDEVTTEDSRILPAIGEEGLTSGKWPTIKAVVKVLLVDDNS